MIETLKPAIIGLLTGFIAWIARGFYNRHFEIKPKINLKIEKNGGFHGMDSNHSFYLLKWWNRFILINNSGYTAYNIKFFFPNKKKIIDNFQEFDNLFYSNYHLKSLDKKEFRIETVKREKSINVFNMEELKYKDPINHFMPKELLSIQLLIEYENERGKKFYTEFIENKNYFSYRRKRKFKKYFA